MNMNSETVKIAILDDYQEVALQMADWSSLETRAVIQVFSQHIDEADVLVDMLSPFDIICVMRERTPLSRTIIERLPRPKLIASTGLRNASIDLKAAEERGIAVKGTSGSLNPPIELTWALILANARSVASENASLRSGGWQSSVGSELRSKILGVLGLGHIGGQVARIGQAFGMKSIAWSEHLTQEQADEFGARFVSKEELSRESHVLSIHMVLVAATRGLVGAEDLAVMKGTAYLVNTSRGPIVDERALIDALTSRKIAGAALDVFDTEPLPANHPSRFLNDVLATPHLGYVSREQYRVFYCETVENITHWLDERQAACRPMCVHDAQYAQD